MSTANRASDLKLQAMALVLFLVSLTLVSAGIKDVGITWDEPNAHFKGSEILREWMGEVKKRALSGDFSSIFEESFNQKYWPPSTRKSQDSVGFNDHPPLSRILPAVSWYLFHGIVDDISAYRLSSAILFSVSVSVVFTAMARELNFAAGLFSALSLLLMPRAFGHAHIAATDMPMMAFWLFSVVAFHKGLTGAKWSFGFAVLLGLAWEVKFTGLLIPLALALYILLARDDRARRPVLWAAVLSPVVLLALNPTWWRDPLTRFYKNFVELFLTRSEFTPIPTYYLGKTYAFDLPWHHAFVLTAVTVPLGILLFSLAGIGLSLRYVFERRLTSLFLAQIMVFYFVMTLPFTPNHDGVRLFLPVFPFFACFAGVGFYGASEILKKYVQGARPYRLPFEENRLVAVVFVCVLIVPAVNLAAIHPYYLEYFNGLAGGIQGAHNKGFETTYWLDTLSRDARKDLNEIPAYAKVGVFPPVYPYFQYLQEKGLIKRELIFTPQEPEFLILIPRQGKFDADTWNRFLNEKPIYAALVDSVAMVLVYQLAPNASPKSAN